MGCILSRLGSYSSPTLAADGSTLLGSSVAASNADAWLTSLGLNVYAPAFQQAGYDDADVLAQLEERDLEQIQQFTGTIIKPGHRKKILLCSQHRARDHPEALPVATLVTPAEWQRDSIPASRGRQSSSDGATVQAGVQGGHEDLIPGQVNEPATEHAAGLIAPGPASSNDSGSEHPAASSGTFWQPPTSDPQLEGLAVLPCCTAGTLTAADQHGPASGGDLFHVMPAPLEALPPSPSTTQSTDATREPASNTPRVASTSMPCPQLPTARPVQSVDAAQPCDYGASSGSAPTADNTAAPDQGDAEAPAEAGALHTDPCSPITELPCSQDRSTLLAHCFSAAGGPRQAASSNTSAVSAEELGTIIQLQHASSPRPPPPSSIGRATSTDMQQQGAAGCSLATQPAASQGAVPGSTRLCLLGQGFSNFMVQLAPDSTAATSNNAPSSQLPTSTTTSATMEPAAHGRGKTQRPDEPCASAVADMLESPTTRASNVPTPDMLRQPSEPAARTPPLAAAAAAPTRAQSAGSTKPSKAATSTPAPPLQQQKHKQPSSAAASRRHSAVQASLAWATAAPPDWQPPLPAVSKQQEPDKCQAELLRVHSKVTQQLAALASDGPYSSPSPCCSLSSDADRCSPTGGHQLQPGDSMGSIAASIQARVTRLQQAPAGSGRERETKQGARLPSGNLVPLAPSRSAGLPGGASSAGHAAMAGGTMKQHVLEVLNSRKHRLGAQLAAAPEQQQQQAWPHAHALPSASSIAAGSAMTPQLAAVQQHVSKRVKHLDCSS